MPVRLPDSRRAAEWAVLLSALGAAGVLGFLGLARDAVPSAAGRLLVAALYAACAVSSGLALWLSQRQRASATGRQEQERLQDAEHLQLALSGADLGLWDLHFKSGRMNMDARGCEILGYAHGENGHDARAWRALVHPEDAAALGAAIEEHLSGRAPSYSAEHRSRHKQGHWVWLLSRAKVTQRDAGGAPLRMVGTQMDITARKEAEAALQRANQQLIQMANVDALTRLANRRLFDSTLMSEFARGVREMAPLAVLMIDIDHFQLYNDHHGQVGGDEALAKVARVLRHCVHRTGDVVARYGGEEFALLLPSTSLSGAQVVARRCIANIAQARLPHAASPLAAFVTVSIGVASMVCDTHVDPMVLVRQADDALHRAKEAGRARFACAAEQAALPA